MVSSKIKIIEELLNELKDLEFEIFKLATYAYPPSDKCWKWKEWCFKESNIDVENFIRNSSIREYELLSDEKLNKLERETEEKLEKIKKAKQLKDLIIARNIMKATLARLEKDL